VSLLKLIRGQKQSSIKEFIQAGKSLMAKEHELEKEMQSLDAEVQNLQLEATLTGKHTERLKEIQLKRLDLPEKLKAVQEALENVKGQVLELLPQETEKRFLELDSKAAALRETEVEQLPEFLHHLARAACLMEVMQGVSADDWKSHLFPIHQALKAAAHRDRDAFVAELKKAKREVNSYREVGNVPAQIRRIDDERSKLKRRSFSLEDAEYMIKTGRFPIEPLTEPKPIRPSSPQW
jgi:ATP-dependent Lon protease